MKKAERTTQKTWWAELAEQRDKAVEELHAVAARGKAVMSDLDCQVETIRDVLGVDFSLKELEQSLKGAIGKANEHSDLRTEAVWNGVGYLRERIDKLEVAFWGVAHFFATLAGVAAFILVLLHIGGVL